MIERENLNIIIDIKRLYSYYLDKYEVACVFREHDKALQYQGTLMGLEQILLQKKDYDWIQEQRAKVEKRRNKIVDLYRELIKE